MKCGICKFLVVLVLISPFASPANAQTLLVTGYPSNSVGEYTTDGKYLGDFIAVGRGGLDQPRNIRFGLDGNVPVLYVASAGTGSVKEYNGVNGAYRRDVVSGLNFPVDFIFDVTGNCYVADYKVSQVCKFSPTGALMTTYTSLISSPGGLAFLPNGDLLVTNTYEAPYANTITEINPVTGVASTFATGLGEPIGITVGPDGRYYVGNSTYADSFGGTNPDTIQVVAASGGVSSTFASGGLDGTLWPAFVGDELFVSSIYNSSVVIFDSTTGELKGLFTTKDIPDGITARLAPIKITSIQTVPAFPGAVVGGVTAMGKITLSKPAPSTGVFIALVNGNPAASIPQGVTVQAGARSASFPISTVAVSTVQIGQLTAISAVNAVKAMLKVRPIGVKSLSLSRTTVKGSKAVVGTVNLELPAAPAGIAVTFTTNNTHVVPAPASITIPAGSQKGTFTVSTNAVTTTTNITISATANGITKTTKLTVTP